MARLAPFRFPCCLKPWERLCHDCRLHCARHRLRNLLAHALPLPYSRSALPCREPIPPGAQEDEVIPVVMVVLIFVLGLVLGTVVFE